MSKILLDTHTFLWLADTPEQLSERVRALVGRLDTERIVSIASLWEIAIKKSLGKLTIRHTVSEFMQAYQDVITFLPIDAPHLAIIETLPLHHRDPFDRLIIAQAMAEQIPVISIDTAFDAYDVERVW